jgi:large subunit ribosomal protein L14
MLQIRSILDVADNTGAKRAAAIGVPRPQPALCPRVATVIKAHIKERTPTATVKKGEVVECRHRAHAASRCAR